MNKFKQIVIPEGNSRLANYLNRLQAYSEAEIIGYESNWASESELVERVSSADCIIIGSSSKLCGNTIRQCHSLKYIGLAATLFTGKAANIDLQAAAKQGVAVAGISDYGDFGVVDFVLSEIIQYLKEGERNRELRGYRIGVIGAGTTGSLVAKALKVLGAEVFYYSRSSKAHLEHNGIHYISLHSLLQTVSILSIHLPRNTQVLGKEELSVFGNEKLLINTSVELPIEPEAMQGWLENSVNTFVADNDGIGYLKEKYETFGNIKYYPRSAGFTEEAQRRLVEMVENNLRQYLNNQEPTK
jgi:hypothetical protein